MRRGRPAGRDHSSSEVAEAHNDQSEASQLRSDSSERQAGLVGGPAEVPGGSHARSAACFVLVLISSGVAVRRAEVSMAEPRSDHVHFDSGLDKVDRKRYLYLILKFP